jgi:hypothetical protein
MSRLLRTPHLRWGTCSWSEKSWVGPFYPAGTKPGDYLAHYGTVFDAVEADSTYYACPPAERVRNWHAVTPGAFVMSTKLPRTAFLGEAACKLDAGRVLIREMRTPYRSPWLNPFVERADGPLRRELTRRYA